MVSEQLSTSTLYFSEGRQRGGKAIYGDMIAIASIAR
jgi:hypothetical protein